jgi:hypothetical protein
MVEWVIGLVTPIGRRRASKLLHYESIQRPAIVVSNNWRAKVSTKPEVFIIESLRLEDEEENRQEGEILARMLKLAGKRDTKYYYIRTERELDEIIDLFDDSEYRYLHISCHAGRRSMSTTFDTIQYETLGEKLHGLLEGRRVFVSACEMSNERLAAAVLKETGCNSLIGPKKAINFDDSAAFWTTFYHRMFKHDDRRMKHREIEIYVRELSKLFGEPINYFRGSASDPAGYKLVNTRIRK